MNAPTFWTLPTDTMVRLATITADAVLALKSLVLRFDGWLAARKRAAQDRSDLAGMSDRELLDIGVSRASIDAAAAGSWSRELPR